MAIYFNISEEDIFLNNGDISSNSRDIFPNNPDKCFLKPSL